MRFLERRIKVQLNTHGGVVLEIVSKSKGTFHVWNTFGGKWTTNKLAAKKNYYSTILEAIIAHMEWELNETLTLKKCKDDGFISRKRLF